ncbi:hypothetical protein TNCV_2577271 [Trichonephila clavipes]|nr:hypothetical protein TNCV_2577271 [Trichonephila clavipes]
MVRSNGLFDLNRHELSHVLIIIVVTAHPVVRRIFDEDAAGIVTSDRTIILPSLSVDKYLLGTLCALELPIPFNIVKWWHPSDLNVERSSNLTTLLS